MIAKTQSLIIKSAIKIKKNKHMRLIKATNYPLQWENRIEQWMNKNGMYQLGKLNQNVMHDLNLFLSILKSYPGISTDFLYQTNDFTYGIKVSCKIKNIQFIAYVRYVVDAEGELTFEIFYTNFPVWNKENSSIDYHYETIKISGSEINDSQFLVEQIMQLYILFSDSN